MNTSKSKILITGVAGLIGSHLSRYLLDKGYQVCGIDNLSGGYKKFVDERVKFTKLDIRRKRDLESYFSNNKFDYVYHLAAYAAEGLSPFIRNFNYNCNLLGSVNVINECIKNDVKKIIFTSSMAVYGENTIPFREEMIPNPNDPYGIAKYAVEMDLRQAYSQFGLKSSVVRPHNVIGIYQNIWDRYRNVIGIWIKRIINKEDILIFGDGQQRRAFSDVQYCLEPMSLLLTKGDGEVFNLGSDQSYALDEVATTLSGIAQEFGYQAKIKYVEPRHEVKRAYCSHKKAQELLEFKDETDIKKTMKDMFKWALDQPYRETKNMKYEINKGMYSYWK